MILLAEQLAEADMSQDLPLLVGPLGETLQSANVASAKSVIVLTDDDVVNLEICLRVRSSIRSVIWFLEPPIRSLQKMSWPLFRRR
jgi:hypothetical protein